MTDDDPRLDPVLLAAIADDLVEMCQSAVPQDRAEARADIPRLIARYEELAAKGQVDSDTLNSIGERIARLRNHLQHA